MSTDNRLGRNPFDKAKAAKAPKPIAQVESVAKTEAVSKTEKTSKTKKVLKTSDKKAEADALAKSLAQPQAQSQPEFQTQPVVQTQLSSFASKEASPALEKEEQIIGEFIELPEENWQPLTIVPSQFLKQILARWI